MPYGVPAAAMPPAPPPRLKPLPASPLKGGLPKMPCGIPKLDIITTYKENGDNRFSIIAKAIIAIIGDMNLRMLAGCPPLARRLLRFYIFICINK